MLPIFMDMKGKNVVVFGGGIVGLRKAKFFATEANVTVVSKTFIPGFEANGLCMYLVKSDVSSDFVDLIDASDMVVIATDDHGLNDMLEHYAREQGKPCNRADGVSTFLIPSVVDRGNYQVAISTLGRSPAMSRYLREHLEKVLGPEYSAMVDLQEQLREQAKEIIPEQAIRERRLWDVLNEPLVWGSLLDDRENALRMALTIMEGPDVHNP